MKDKRIFVSGGAGVIGLEMIPILLNLGAKIFVGDLKPRPESFPPAVLYRQGDLNYLTKGEIESFAPEIFIHLAATFERTTESYEFWNENFWHNLRLSHHLIEIFKDIETLNRVVFASSYLIYDSEQYQFETPQLNPVILNESCRVLPRNLTGTAKYFHEVELAFLESFQACSFTTVCARIFRGYGRNSRDVISRWVRALISGDSIVVYRPEGLFDYIYAHDSADGLVRLISAENLTGIVNLGSGRSRRVQDIVDILRSHFPDMTAEYKASDIPFEASQADMSKFKQYCGWNPKYNLEEAIAEIIKYEYDRQTESIEAIEEKRHNVLVTSASKKIPMVIALQNAAKKLHPDVKVFAGDIDQNALSFYVADDCWVMPPTIESEIDSIIEGCKIRNIKAIFPSRDGELSFWAKNQSVFEDAGINVIVSPLESIKNCLDKLKFAEFGINFDLPFIPAGNHPDEVGAGPYVVKERYGAGSISLGCNLDKDSALEHGKKLKSPIYQPFIEGKEISIDAWIDRSNQVKGVVLRSRDYIVNGESQITTTFRNEEMERVFERILTLLKLRGPVVMQAIVDRVGNIHVIECNSRFGGASTTSISAGLDLFYWSLLESSNIDIKEYPFLRRAEEVRQIRIPSDIYEYGHNF